MRNAKGVSKTKLKNIVNMLYSFHFAARTDPILAIGIEIVSRKKSHICILSSIVSSFDLFCMMTAANIVRAIVNVSKITEVTGNPEM